MITPLKKTIKTEPVNKVLRQKNRSHHHIAPLFVKTSFHLNRKIALSDHNEKDNNKTDRTQSVANKSSITFARKVISTERFAFTNHFPILPNTINIKQLRDKTSTEMPQGDTYDFVLQKTKILVTAKKWGIYDMDTLELIRGYKVKKQHQIASLTKIMTFYCAYLVIARYFLLVQKVQLLVTSKAQDLRGTKANLLTDDLVTLEDLLYGMMLNSGNDAAYVIATNLGLLIKKRNKGQYFSPYDLKDHSKQDYSKIFVHLMNSAAKQLNMCETSFYNCHGMIENKSSVRDLFTLTKECINIPLFVKICSSKLYVGKAKIVNSLGNVQYRNFMCSNTNKLLGNPCYQGVKTGYNVESGGCLVSIYKDDCKNVMMIVLGSSGKDASFRDTQKILEWYDRLQKARKY